MRMYQNKKHRMWLCLWWACLTLSFFSVVGSFSQGKVDATFTDSFRNRHTQPQSSYDSSRLHNYGYTSNRTNTDGPSSKTEVIAHDNVSKSSVPSYSKHKNTSHAKLSTFIAQTKSGTLLDEPRKLPTTSRENLKFTHTPSNHRNFPSVTRSQRIFASTWKARNQFTNILSNGRKLVTVPSDNRKFADAFSDHKVPTTTVNDHGFTATYNNHRRITTALVDHKKVSGKVRDHSRLVSKNSDRKMLIAEQNNRRRFITAHSDHERMTTALSDDRRFTTAHDKRRNFSETHGSSIVQKTLENVVQHFPLKSEEKWKIMSSEHDNNSHTLYRQKKETHLPKESSIKGKKEGDIKNGNKTHVDKDVGKIRDSEKREEEYQEDWIAAGMAGPDEEPKTGHSKEFRRTYGILVASWRWHEIGLYFTFTACIVVAGFAKVAFHHARFLSSKLPESCLFIILGVIVGGILHLSGVPSCNQSYNASATNPECQGDRPVFPEFTPNLFFLFLLPPIILESAYSIYCRAFFENLASVLVYAVVGTVMSTFYIGPMLYLINYIGGMGFLYMKEVDRGLFVQKHTLTIYECLVFSSLISAVDPITVLAIFQEIEVKKDLYMLVFGESLLNDAVTVVLYSTMVEFTAMDSARIPISGSQYALAILAFVVVCLAGLSIGIVFGLLTALFTKTTSEIRVVEPLAVLGLAYLSYVSAEVFHFSGIISIIGCGLIQAHYSFKNISSKSYTTVKYFTKMLSATSDTVIFLFLGMVVVSDKHHWHTGFILWTLFFCLTSRCLVVFLLTLMVNHFRVKKINIEEQFISAFGGLRGAVGFSLVEMLSERDIPPRQIFVTTTLFIIFFTVFIQGGTIKGLVRLLQIEQEKTEMKTLTEEINEHVIDHLMAGVEIISGKFGELYLTELLEYYDDHYLKKWFLCSTSENDLTRLYEKRTLFDHYTHLYGPMVLLANESAGIIHDSEDPIFASRFPVKAATPQAERSYIAKCFVDCLPCAERKPEEAIPGTSQESTEEPPSPSLLRSALRQTPYSNFYYKHNRNLIHDDSQEIQDLLHERHVRAQRMNSVVSMGTLHSVISMKASYEQSLAEFPPMTFSHSDFDRLNG